MKNLKIFLALISFGFILVGCGGPKLDCSSSQAKSDSTKEIMEYYSEKYPNEKIILQGGVMMGAAVNSTDMCGKDAEAIRKVIVDVKEKILPSDKK